jgi:hypothetical protein
MLFSQFTPHSWYALLPASWPAIWQEVSATHWFYASLPASRPDRRQEISASVCFPGPNPLPHAAVARRRAAQKIAKHLSAVMLWDLGIGRAASSANVVRSRLT